MGMSAYSDAGIEPSTGVIAARVSASGAAFGGESVTCNAGIADG